jgi:hypothetical protein
LLDPTSLIKELLSCWISDFIVDIGTKEVFDK